MEIRKDFLKNESIIYASARSNKPTNYKNDTKTIVKENVDFKADCPFCENYDGIIGDLLLFDEENKIRIVKNRFPVVQGEIGFHDVAIESPNHDLKMKDMSENLIFDFLKLVIKRCEMILEHKNIKHIQLFKNNGPFSGASLEHSHWQILSLSYIPKTIVEISNNFKAYSLENNRCYLCDSENSYGIIEDTYMKMVLPKASYIAQTFRVYPKTHKGSLLELDNDELLSLSKMLVFGVNLISKLDEGNSYNIIFYSKPIEFEDDEPNTTFHFFVEIVGRKGRMGGFELSTGEYTSSILPEELYNEIKSLLPKNTKW